MKNENVPQLKNKTLSLLPIAQKELQKRLSLSSQDTSRLIQLMDKEHLIKREKLKIGYLIMQNGVHPIESPLINKVGIFSPCTGCKIECRPELCTPITDWILA